MNLETRPDVETTFLHVSSKNAKKTATNSAKLMDDRLVICGLSRFFWLIYRKETNGRVQCHLLILLTSLLIYLPIPDITHALEIS